MRPDDALLQAAAAYAGVMPRRVVVVTCDRRLSVEPIGKVQLQQGEPVGTVGRWFSPEEELIVEALRKSGGWMTSQQIADATSQPNSGAFSTLLSNLARREITESSTRNGHRLAQQPGA